MTKTKINGKWVNDPIKDYSNGSPSSRQPAQTSKVQAQHKAMAEALSAVAQCKSITEVRKVLTHGRAVYPR